MSVRELGRLHGIPENRISSLHDKARQKDLNGQTWYEKRAAFERLSGADTMKLMALKEAQRRLRRIAVSDHAIELIDQYIGAMSKAITATKIVTRDDGTEVEEPTFQPNVKDLTALLDRLAELFGQQSTSITLTEERRLGVSTPAGQLDDGILAGLAAFAARSVGPRLLEPAGAGASPLPSAPGPRPDQ